MKAAEPAEPPTRGSREAAAIGNPKSGSGEDDLVNAAAEGMALAAALVPDGWRSTVPGADDLDCDRIRPAPAARPDLPFAVEIPMRLRRGRARRPLGPGRNGTPAPRVPSPASPGGPA